MALKRKCAPGYACITTNLIQTKGESSKSGVLQGNILASFLYFHLTNSTMLATFANYTAVLPANLDGSSLISDGFRNHLDQLQE